MKIDTTIELAPGDTGAPARAAEQAGYDGAWVSEIKHDPFPALAVAATATERIELGTSIAVAFARNPMSLAVTANDLQLHTRGRFILGVGSQIEPHITKRFSMPWSAPAVRMREYLEAVRAIWRAWETGERLNFRGDFYTHTLMTPFFDPGPNPHGNPPIMLAGVGWRMTRVAGQVADGFFVHGFTTERYLRDVTLPELAEARAQAGSDRGPFAIVGSPFVVTGSNAEEMRTAATAVRKQVAFYGSTPAYRPVLDAHGWGELGEELNGLSKRGRWEEMGERIDDEVLDAFAVVAEPDQVAQRILDRFGDAFTRMSIYAPYETPEDFWTPVVESLREP